jgi:hypothetical protein
VSSIGAYQGAFEARPADIEGEDVPVVVITGHAPSLTRRRQEV